MEMKSKIPYGLAFSRLAMFIPLILSTFEKKQLSLKQQIAFMSAIMSSDILDGVISRKYNEDEKDKIMFRLTDTVIDKIGIFSSMVGLYKSKKIPKDYFKSI